MSKAQSTVVMMVFVILIFLGIILFLLSFANTADRTDYENLYLHNLLLSLMRADTGEDDVNCKLVSDSIACAFTMTSDYICGTQTCKEVADEKLTEYMLKFENIRKNYRYLFVVESGSDFITIDEETGQPLKILIGDPALETARIDKLKANYKITRSTAGGQYDIDVQLFVAEK